MEYLNNFRPNSGSLDEAQSSKEFSRSIILNTSVDLMTKHPEITGMDIEFDPDKIVFEGNEVLVEFMDWKDEPVIKLLNSDNIPGVTSGGFPAVEMFYKLISTQLRINEYAGDFKKIEYVENMEWEGKTLPLYRVDFSLH